MPRDLFGEVTRPSVSIGNRKWYTVPVSLLSHAFVIAALFVLPIVAAPLMPNVFDLEPTEYLIDVLPPPPPPPAPRRAEALKPIANLNAAPLTPPDTIAPEKPLDLEWQNTASVGIVGGVDRIEEVIITPPPPVAAVPQPPKPVQVGGVIRRPTKVGGPDPLYPPMARAAGVQGIVIIEATIGADGGIINARILRSVPLLDQAALEAVRQWRYTPTLLNGVPVPVIMTVTVSFTLSR